MQCLHDELDSDEAQNHGKSKRQIHQLVEQLSEQEVQLLQTEQREHIGREHNERILRQTENRRNGIKGKHHIGGADGQKDDQHRSPILGTVFDGTQLFSVILIGDLDDLAQCANQAILMIFLVLVSPGDQLDGGDDKECTEQEEHPGEAGDNGRADEDEHAAQHQCDGDADGQHEFLQLFWHRKIRHNDDEDE